MAINSVALPGTLDAQLQARALSMPSDAPQRGTRGEPWAYHHVWLLLFTQTPYMLIGEHSTTHPLRPPTTPLGPLPRPLTACVHSPSCANAHYKYSSPPAALALPSTSPPQGNRGETVMAMATIAAAAGMGVEMETAAAVEAGGAAMATMCRAAGEHLSTSGGHWARGYVAGARDM